MIDGLYRRDTYELPVGAIREIITNAVLHRSYVDQTSIQVSIFDDRIEIDSPGMLCAGLSVKDALSGERVTGTNVLNKTITAAQVISITRITTQQGASAALNRLIKQGLIEKKHIGRQVYYQIK